MKWAKLLLIGIVGGTLMFGPARSQINPPSSSQLTDGMPVKKLLLDGSPWTVVWNNTQQGGSGVFKQTFAVTQDGRVKTTTDEVGPYETLIEFPSEGQAVWTSPHGRTITISVKGGRVVGSSFAVTLGYRPRQ